MKTLLALTMTLSFASAVFAAGVRDIRDTRDMRAKEKEPVMVKEQEQVSGEIRSLEGRSGEIQEQMDLTISALPEGHAKEVFKLIDRTELPGAERAALENREALERATDKELEEIEKACGK